MYAVDVKTLGIHRTTTAILVDFRLRWSILMRIEWEWNARHPCFDVDCSAGMLVGQKSGPGCE